MLYVEMQAWKAYGIDPEVGFEKPRLNRIAVTAQHLAENTLSAMKAYDDIKRRQGKS